MVFVLGIDLYPFMQVKYAIRRFQGIGTATAQRICNECYIHPLAKMSDLNLAQLEKLKAGIQVVLEKHKKEKMDRLKHDRKMAQIIPKYRV